MQRTVFSASRNVTAKKRTPFSDSRNATAKQRTPFSASRNVAAKKRMPFSASRNAFQKQWTAFSALRTNLAKFCSFISMKFLLTLLLLGSTAWAQTPCEDFLAILGRSDTDERLVAMQTDCGPFTETVASDNATKKWVSKEKGITLIFTNSETNATAEPKFELTTIELSSTTSKGGYTGQLPFGLKKEMNAHEISDHIKKTDHMEYTNRELGMARSYFTYVGDINEVTAGKKIKIYLEQYRAAGISTMRLRLI